MTDDIQTGCWEQFFHHEDSQAVRQGPAVSEHPVLSGF